MAKRKPWLKSEIATLKKLAKQKTPARVIAKTLRRTVGAVRQKASILQIALRTRKRTRRK